MNSELQLESLRWLYEHGVITQPKFLEMLRNVYTETLSEKERRESIYGVDEEAEKNLDIIRAEIESEEYMPPSRLESVE